MTAPARLQMALIYPSDHGRAVVTGRVGVLVESLQALGLRTPITVRPCVKFKDGRESDAFEIVTGRHRYEAARTLGWKEIDAVVMEGDADDAELWEIDENFARAELTDAQRADHHVRREAILVKKGLVSAPGQGGDRTSNEQKVRSYSAQTAEALGVHEKTVRQDLRRGKNIAADVLADVTGTDLDKGVVLNELAALKTAEEQRARVEQMRAEPRRSTVKLAADPLNDPEAHEKQLAALMSAWNRAAAVVRAEFLLRIEQPVFDNTEAGKAP